MKGKHVTLSIITIIAFMAIVIYATYAYIAPSINIQNVLNISTNTSQGLVFSATGGNGITSNISFSSMADYNLGLVATGTDSFDVNLQTDGIELVCCAYNIIYTPNTSAYSYTKSVGATGLEYTYTLSAVDHYHDGSSTVDVNRSIKAETNFPNYASNAGDITLASYNVCNQDNVNGGFYTNVTETVNIIVKFYNLNVNQDAFQNKTLKGTFSVDRSSVNCTRTRSY